MTPEIYTSYSVCSAVSMEYYLRIWRLSYLILIHRDGLYISTWAGNPLALIMNVD
jgi:hypothetical protein